MKSQPHSLGIGVDIEDIQRFANKPYELNESFYTKIFSENELSYCLSKQNPYPHFAVRFCAKEAFMKAYPTQIGDYTSIEVVTSGNKPFVVHKGIKYTASLSHDKDKAIATVLL